MVGDKDIPKNGKKLRGYDLMAKTVIQFNKLGKSYMIGHKGQDQRYVALRDIIGESMRKWWSRIRHPEYYTHENLEEFWALKDIDLEVKVGDRLGIIGRNGAGKTTLLKVLSQITEPTAGKINIKGRVASLLEVGTGFHPELTGRENIYLNGAILGMTRSEIKRKFDEIVDFAGVEHFLDTPVKRFSSGMAVRLGFSVAAHLEPEILVVDEVLAVGDVSFQKKCIGKMDSVAKEGRTILFVSHQMQAIANLCNRAILLDRGKISHHGDTGDVISTYLNNATNPDSFTRLSERKDRQGLGQIRWIDTWIENDHNEKINMVMSGEDFFITGIFEILNTIPSLKLSFAFALYNHKAEQLTDLTNVCIDRIFSLNGKLKTCYQVRSKIKRNPLASGFYTYNMMLRNNNDVEDFLLGGGAFQVENGDFFKTGKMIQSGQGSLLFDQEWELEPMEG